MNIVRWTVIFSSCLALSGCCLFTSVVPNFDQATLTQVEKTITYETEVYKLISAELERVGASLDLREEVKTRHDSELTRLENWRKMELSKQRPSASGGG